MSPAVKLLLFLSSLRGLKEAYSETDPRKNGQWDQKLSYRRDLSPAWLLHVLEVLNPAALKFVSAIEICLIVSKLGRNYKSKFYIWRVGRGRGMRFA
jgi:hypothetical protein